MRCSHALRIEALNIVQSERIFAFKTSPTKHKPVPYSSCVQLIKKLFLEGEHKFNAHYRYLLQNICQLFQFTVLDFQIVPFFAYMLHSLHMDNSTIFYHRL